MKKTFVCQYCNSDFERPIFPSSRNTFEFCSPSCRNKARALNKIACPVCGVLFSPRVNDTVNGKSMKKRYCSPKCASYAKRGRASTNPKTHTEKEREYVRNNYTTKGISLISEKLKITRRAVYCLAHKIGLNIESVDYSSMSEHMKKNNPMKNLETAAKVGKILSQKYHEDTEYRIRFLKSIAEANKKSMTKPELLCKSILEEIGIEAEYQVEIKSRFIVDFRIGNIILQVDGEYWHGHPRFEPLTDRQITQRKKDAAQDKYLTACGYRIVRVWENDITKENILLLLS